MESTLDYSLWHKATLQYGFHLEDPALVNVVLEREGLDHGTKGVGVNHSAAHYCSKSGFSEKRGKKWKPHRKMPFVESNMRERGAPDTRGCGGILFFTSSFRSAESSAQPGTLWRRPLPRRTLQDGRLPFGLDRHQGTIPTFYAHLTFYKYGYYAN